MKKLAIILLPILLAGCSYSTLSEEVELSLEVSDTEIILGADNEYHQNVDFTWSLRNDSLQPISSDQYELDLMTAEPGAFSATMLQEFDLEVDPQSELSDVYTHLFDSIGVEGEYEFQLVLYEKDGEYFQEIKKVTVPYGIYWE